jgi:hypothetical protein
MNEKIIRISHGQECCNLTKHRSQIGDHSVKVAETAVAPAKLNGLCAHGVSPQNLDARTADLQEKINTALLRRENAERCERLAINAMITRDVDDEYAHRAREHEFFKTEADAWKMLFDPKYPQ